MRFNKTDKLDRAAPTRFTDTEIATALLKEQNRTIPPSPTWCEEAVSALNEIYRGNRSVATEIDNIRLIERLTFSGDGETPHLHLTRQTRDILSAANMLPWRK